MTEDQTQLKLDLIIKKILAYRPVFVRILKGTMSEFKDMSLEEVDSCIKGDIQVAQMPVEPGLGNTVPQGPQEDYVSGEGVVKYDIRSYVLLPGEDHKTEIKIFVNVEAQKNDTPGYAIPERGLFYACRMISAQLGTEFTNAQSDPKKYSNIKKVYSIWICTNTADKRSDSIDRYHIQKEIVHGVNSDNPRYDLLEVIVVNVGSKGICTNSENEMISMLSDLLDDRIDKLQKMRVLDKKHHIPLDQEFKEEVTDMLAYTSAIVNEAEAKGTKRGFERGLEQGLEQKAIQVYYTCLERNLSKEDAIAISGITKEMLEKHEQEFDQSIESGQSEKN